MKKLKVSYSQFSMWNQCPWRWKLTYIDKIKIDEPSIYLIFGSAMHYVLQMYLTAFFSNGPKYTDRLDLNNILMVSIILYRHHQKELEQLTTI